MIELAKKVEEFGSSAMAEGLTHDSFTSLWAEIGLKEVDLNGIGEQIFEEVFLSSIRTEESGALSEELHYSPGGWILKFWSGATRSVILSALMWAMLSMAGYPQLPIVVIPAVLPLLFDVEKVRLSASQECVYTALTLQPEVREKKLGAEELYSALPEKMRDELSFLDFIEFLEACYKSGLAQKHGDGDLTVHREENRSFRLTIE